MTAKMHKDCQQLRDLIEISVHQLQGIASCGLITVNGENRMEGLVCWSNYGGNGSLNTQKSEGLGRCLAGHEIP